MRFDEYLTVNRYFESRNKAKNAIEKGLVFINGEKILKPSKEIADGENPTISIEETETFVSVGGHKLSKALKDFNFSVCDLVVADIGASTGGFTDCLIQNGAKKVYAVDLNDELLHPSLKNDDKVVRVIKNAKNLTTKDVKDITLITADLSFISAKQVLPVFYNILPEIGKVILLIKPQFEMDKKRVFKNGIVKDDKARKDAVRAVYDAALENGFSAVNMTTAPIDKNKNLEFLILLSKDKSVSSDFDILYKHQK